MKVLVTLDTNGHFGAILIENDIEELRILRSIMQNVLTCRWHYSDEQKAEAYKLANEGSIEEIVDWMEENDLAMGRVGGGRIDIVKAHKDIHSNFVQNLML